MIVGTCTIELRLPGNGSLKGKRRVLKSLMARIHREFNVAVAEVDGHDSWQRAVLGMACVSTNSGHAHAVLSKAVAHIQNGRYDLDVVDFHIEMW